MGKTIRKLMDYVVLPSLIIFCSPPHIGNREGIVNFEPRKGESLADTIIVEDISMENSRYDLNRPLVVEGEEVVQDRRLQEVYSGFRFPNELETIDYHARRIGVETSLLLSIREAENGEEGLQFGIIPNSRYEKDRGYFENGVFNEYPEDGDLSRQVSWAGATIRANRRRFANLDASERNNYVDFIDFLGNRYAPENADNDPNGLNEYWASNVRQRYEIHQDN